MAVDRGAIDAQLRDIGEGDRWWEHREFRDLPHILHADERIQGIVSGQLLGPRLPRLRPGSRWLIVATGQRLLCLKQERFARKQVEIAAGQVVRIHGGSRLRSYQIVVETPQRAYRLRIRKEDAFRFAAALEPLIAKRPDGEPAPRPWLPGINALPGVAGFLSKGSGHARADDAARAHLERLEDTVERLQDDVERLQQQVAFLEDLLQKRAEDALLQRSSAGS